MARQPAMRVSNANDFFHFLGRQYPAAQEHLVATLPPEVLAPIRGALRTDWIPVELDGIAAEGLRFRSYPDVWEGIFLAIYDLAGVEPQLEFSVDRPQRRVEAVFRW